MISMSAAWALAVSSSRGDAFENHGLDAPDDRARREDSMKGLILAAGLGTRLRPITSLRPKPTISVANRPLIHHAVDNLRSAGIDHIGVVVGVATEVSIRETLADN